MIAHWTMISILRLSCLSLILCGMFSCEEKQTEEIPKIMDSGLSFGPFRGRGDGYLIQTSLRVKYTNDDKLRWIVEVSPTENNEGKFGDVVQLLLSESKSGSWYKNTIKFSLKDKEGFVLEEIRISDSIRNKGNYMSRDGSVLVEYTGNIKLSKDMALRLSDCDMHPEFESDLEKLISSEK